MEQADLVRITRTYENYRVKNLRYNKVENIIVGQVEDPLRLRPNLHDGYISCVWNTNGYPIKQNKGREELRIDIW